MRKNADPTGETGEHREEDRMERMKLRGRIAERYGTNKAFAEKIGVTKMTVTNVLKKRSTPTQKQMLKWCEALGIDPSEIGIFFYE